MTQHLRLAVRALRRTPAFAVVATLIFALASGAVIASLALVHAVLLRPLPVRDQGRLVIAWKEDFKAGFAHFPFSHPSTEEIRRHLTTTSAVATIDYNGAWPLSTVDGDAAFKLPTGQVSGDFFQVLGVEPVVGRLFRPEDDAIGGPRLIAIGEKLWRSRYGADSSIIGRRIEIFGIAHEIVGVVPGDFEYPRGAVAWMPMYPWQGAYLDGQNAVTQDIVARLKPGVTLAQFTAELERIRSTSPLEIRPDFANHRVVSRSFTDAVVGDLRPTLLLIGAGALLVLIVASANMGSLLLIRAGSRLHEIAIRVAIGASRGRVWGAVMLEYGLVIVAGVGSGVVVASAALRAAQTMLTVDLPRAAALRLTWQAVAGGGTLSLVVAAIGAAVAGGTLLRADFARALRSGRWSAPVGWGAHPLRRHLVAVQLALAVTAVAGAGLLARTFDRLEAIDLGLKPRNLLFGDITVSVPVDSAFQVRAPEVIDRLVDAVERVPGVTSAATTFSPPFVGAGGAYSRMRAEGQPQSELGGMPLANREAVTPGYFATMGMSLRRGRFLEPSDDEDAAPVVVVNEALARFHWPGRDPIGQRLGYADAPEPRWRTVVGVVANARYNELKVPSPAIYVPYRQIDERPWYLVIRTAPEADQAAIVPGLRRAIRELGNGLALVSAQPMQALLSGPLDPVRTTALLTLGFALIALLLAGFGIYGVLASIVVERTREFGIRMALGATGPTIAGLVVRQALRLIATGVAAGLSVSFLVGRGLQGLLYEVTPLDPATFAIVALVLLLMSTVALLVPALRAVRVDPTVSLRSE